MKNRDFLAIVRRLSTIKNTDEIVVADKGIIAECGIHCRCPALLNHVKKSPSGIYFQ
jgi:ABC-type transport system involved in Fe-S cluster assembly fused permease/ATPase subunit